MLIRHSNEKERTREGGTMPRIREVGKETLVMQKSSNNSNNHWSFRYHWQKFKNMDRKFTDRELLRSWGLACSEQLRSSETS